MKTKIMLDRHISSFAGAIKKQRQLIIITDKNVNRLYGRSFPKAHVVVIKGGESRKNLKTVTRIYKKLIKLDVDRESFILGIGGGIVCDITGFVASTFMRGVNFGFIPTTLLAQVDASLGGKNGVNLKHYKNMVGLVRQPELVYYDLDVLKTLEPKEIKCGLSEVIKHAIIADKKLFDFIVKNPEKIASLDKKTITRLIKSSIKIKLSIVNMDEEDHNKRRSLNLGHTLGHAIEAVSKGKVSHGEAVAIGMCFSARFSHKLGILKEKDLNEILDAVSLFGLPTELADVDLQKEPIIEAINKDKKRSQKQMDFLLVKKVGTVVIKKLDVKVIGEALNALC